MKCPHLRGIPDPPKCPARRHGWCRGDRWLAYLESYWCCDLAACEEYERRWRDDAPGGRCAP